MEGMVWCQVLWRGVAWCVEGARGCEPGIMMRMHTHSPLKIVHNRPSHHDRHADDHRIPVECVEVMV